MATCGIPTSRTAGTSSRSRRAGYQSIFDNFDSGPTSGNRSRSRWRPTSHRPDVLKGPKTGLHFADFDRRRARGEGTFFTRAQLEGATRAAARQCPEGRCGTRRWYRGRATARRCVGGAGERAEPCYAAVVRDGVRVYPFEGANPPDLEKIFAEKLAAVEFYPRPALVPAELRDASTCGALVLWSRGGGR